MDTIMNYALSDFKLSYNEYLDMCDASLRHKTDYVIKQNLLHESMLIISQAILLKNKQKRKTVRFKC